MLSGNSPTRRIARFGVFEMDLDQRELRRNGLKVKLQEQPFQLLAALLERPGELITREELRRKLWPADTFVDFDHSINAAIRRLRDALGDDPDNPRFIETVPRYGYRLLADFGMTESGGPKQPSDRQTTGVSLPQSRFRSRSILVVLGTLAVIGLTMTHYATRVPTPGRPSMKTIPLTSLPGAEGQPAFSSDGDQVAFIWDGNTTETTNVFVKRIGSDRPLQLTHNSGFVCCPAWTSDNKYVGFERCSGENIGIFLVPSLGGPERKLRKTVGCPGLSWSPTNQVLAFAEKSAQDVPFALYLMSLNDLQPHQLTFPEANVVGDQNPVFSPDGKTVAFIRIIGESVTDIYTVPVSGGAIQRLTFDKPPVIGLTWTTDGTKIVFSSHRGGGSSLWTVSLRGGEPERLPLGGATAFEPTISRKGNRLAYTQGWIHPNLWSIEIGNRGKVPSLPRPFVKSATYNNGPQFSPDGKKVAFASALSGDIEVWTCDAEDCSEPQQLTFQKGLSGMPRWSPDGKRIVFDSRPDRHTQIFMVNAEGGSPVALTDGKAEDKVPSWSSDGRFVYFSSNRSGPSQIWKVAVGGGRPSQVTKHGGFAAFESSDGKFLYYAKEDEPGIWRNPTSGGDEVRIVPELSTEYWGDWALSDRGIYYVHATNTRPAIEFFDFASHKVSIVAQVNGLPPGGDPGFAVSPDGKRIIFSQVDASAVDLMLVENFR
jgi:Tol biopolymer transport system component/DNA-binding winged helix-turn-helix (wHTH) protein